MNVYYWLFTVLLTLSFFLIIFSALKSKNYSFNTIWVGNDVNIEARLRLLMKKKPRSEIVVFNNSTLSETGEILEKMQYDFPEIHIVSY